MPTRPLPRRWRESPPDIVPRRRSMVRTGMLDGCSSRSLAPWLFRRFPGAPGPRIGALNAMTRRRKSRWVWAGLAPGVRAPRTNVCRGVASLCRWHPFVCVCLCAVLLFRALGVASHGRVARRTGLAARGMSELVSRGGCSGERETERRRAR